MMKQYIAKIITALMLALPAIPSQAQNYIHNKAHAKFNTNVLATENTRIEAHLKVHQHEKMPLVTDEFGIFGSRNFYISWHAIALQADFEACTGKEKVSIPDIPFDEDYYVTLKSGSCIVDVTPGASVHKSETTWAPSIISNPSPIYIGGVLSPTDESDCTIYEFRIYENDVLKMHLIPALHNGKYMLYDTRSATFLSPIGFDCDGQIESCYDHKYVDIEKKDGKYHAHCCICDEWMSLENWQKPEELNITVVEPYFDTEADTADIGQQKMFVTSVNKIKQVCIIDTETDELVYHNNSVEDMTSQITLPQTDRQRNLVLLTEIYHSDMKGTSQDTTFLWSSTKVTQQPFHTLNNVAVKEVNDIDAYGNKTKTKAMITFDINNPGDVDVMPQDHILIQRAYNDDFSDAVTVGSVAFDDSTSYGHYTYIDDLDIYQAYQNPKDSIYCVLADSILANPSLSTKEREILKEFYTYPDRHMNYRVVRALAANFWPNHADAFRADLKESPTAMLPPVSAVTVEKTPTWNDDNTVKVRVELQNPYPWQFNELLDSTKIYTMLHNADTALIYRRYMWDEKARLVIQRYSPAEEYYKGEDYAAKTLIINGTDVRWDAAKGVFYAETEDVQNLPYTHYYYNATTDEAESFIPPCTYNLSVSSSREQAYMSENAALIDEIEADQGTEKGRVTVKWQMGNTGNAEIKLYRKAMYSEQEQTWQQLDIDAEEHAYVDETVIPGTIYEYKLVASITYHDKNYTAEKTCKGWASYYGTIAGKVIMSDGTGIADAKVIVTRHNPVFIPDVIDEFGNMIMPGIHEGAIAQAKPRNASGEQQPIYDYTFEYCDTVITDQNGAFRFDSLLYNATNTEYNIKVEYGISQFTLNTSSDLTLSGKRCEYEDLEFVCTSTYKFAGRVLYENSTVPVRGAGFMMNGKQLLSSNGKPVATDNEGNFSIIVPRTKMTLKVVKEGHTFVEEYIKDKDGATEFTPQQDYAGLILYDKTKVRLAGRIAGGSKQGNKPIGFGESKNNLGDDLTMILQLEGNNTAQIVYLKDEPDNTEINDTVAHPYNGGTTTVSYQKKRIVIKPDVATGEFFVDLFPTQYKVIQLSAKGYSTLFASGEGFEVLDLSDSIHSRTVEATFRSEKKSVTYHATYHRIYHNPVTVTYQQYRYGQKVPYFGEDRISERNLLGTKFNATVASADKAGNVTYTFGHPVFVQGNRYTLKVRAHEDYYYNGDTSQRADEVDINGGLLHVRNGLYSLAGDDEVYELDTLGTRTIVIDAANTNFSLTGEDALKALHMQVEVNGYYYDAEPLEAYVFGSRSKGTDVLASLTGDIELLDIVRDPYGSGSSAYREAGTKYHWNYDYSKTTDVTWDLKFVAGPGFNFYTGFMFATSTSASATGTVNVRIPGEFSIERKSTQYEMTLNQRITTSANKLDVGAMADVYLGAVNAVNVSSVEAVSIIDSISYGYLAEAVRTGAVKVLTSGRDANGNAYYVVVGEKLSVGKEISEVFAYSQKHIVGTLIPDLQKKRDALLRTASKAELQTVADATGKPQYRLDETLDDGYERILPANAGSRVFPDEVAEYNHAIANWEGIVAYNEKAKIDAKTSGIASHYSVAGTTLNYSESASQYYTSKTVNPDRSAIISGGAGGGNSGFQNKSNDHNKVKDEKGNDTDEDASTLMAAGIIFNFSFNKNESISKSETENYYAVSTMGSGYNISTNDNGYLDFDVYRVVADKAIMLNSKLKSISNAPGDTAKIHDYVFYVRGGAQRNPWYAPDSTLYYEKGTPLGVQTLKIDNPRIYVDNPVVSNLPDDETAYFTLHLTNDSEISDKSSYLNPSAFTLLYDTSTNPDGASLSVDGVPLGNGRDFYIAPGQSLTKTLAVKRGTKYDVNNLKLIFREVGLTLKDYATISVHYVPVATPVNISSPADKWVMNTLSASDEQGFYIPVKLEGFNVNSEGFHHIELQYKKKTESESQYANLCSFFTNDSLYNLANGNKQMIVDGKIENFKFYGEKDPVEMEYDLRAVSFRQLGTGFITRVSNIMSGKKDTRNPEIFGLPAPSSSILTFEDVPTLTFTEPIAYNYLDKTSNFQLIGYTNETDILQSSTLRFPGDSLQSVYTTVERNLSNRDFTIDMMIRKEAGGDKAMTLFSHGDEAEFINFFITADNSLCAVVGDGVFSTAPLDVDLSSALTHVGMSYGHKEGMVRFFVNNSYVPNSTNEHYNKPARYNSSGIVHLGSFFKGEDKLPFKGDMLEVRLWGKVLTDNELRMHNGKHLTGYEQQLIADWPLTETYGNTARDAVHGANLVLEGVDWNNIDGYSLHVDRQPVELNAEAFATERERDYSLQFWFKADEVGSTPTGRSALLKVGADYLEKGHGKLFVGFEGDNLVVNTNDTSLVVGRKADYVQKGWHHFMMTVNRPLNRFAVYMDSKLTYESDATLIDGLASDYAALGDTAFVGNFDLMALWDVALPDYYIKDFFNSCLFGSEMGLRNYLPFHSSTTNSQNTRVLDFSAYNEIIRYNDEGKVSSKKDKLITAELTDANRDKVNHAPVRESPELQNLDFSWSSNGTALQININELDSKINKQYIYLTVRGVEDLNGNSMTSPVMWSCYVDKNILQWNAQTIEMEAEPNESAVAKAEWKNISGKRLDFTIGNLPAWLTIDRTEGMATAEQEGYFTLTSNKDLAAGKYTETIYLVDENGLAEPLIINLTVKAPDTGWKVDKTKYDRTMNLMGQVVLSGYSALGDENAYRYIDDNTNDKVAAFIAGECVGVANITNDPKLGAYVLMTIYGDSLIAQSRPAKNITLLLWRHDTGVIYELENMLPDGTSAPITFATNSTVGLPPAEPLVLYVSNRMEQDLYLNEGWNWVSFNVSPRAIDGINSVFINQTGLFSDDDIIKHVDFAQYSEKYKSWLGTLGKTDYKHVYQIFVRNAGTYKLLGNELTQDDMTITVKPGWNDMPYLLQESEDINQALADFQIGDKAKTGDIIKSYDEFAVAKESADGGTGSWIGTLKYLTPGKGYYLKHNGEETQFTYQKNTMQSSSALPAGAKQVGSRAAANTPENMPVIAVFDETVDCEDTDVLTAYVNDEKVGEAVRVEGRFFLVVHANEGDAIVLAQEREGKVLAKTKGAIRFRSAAVVGSLDAPLKVSFSDSDTSADTSVYDLGGRKLNANGSRPASIYIKGGRKVKEK